MAKKKELPGRKDKVIMIRTDEQLIADMDFIADALASEIAPNPSRSAVLRYAITMAKKNLENNSKKSRNNA